MRPGGHRQRLLRACNRHFFVGWTMLAVAALGMFASGPGQSYTFGVFLGPIGDELGLSGTALASAYGLATLAAAFGLPVMGRLVDRFGSRRMLLVAVSALGIACVLFGTAGNVVTLALGFAALRFFGQGALMLTCSNLVSQWFSRRRGFALSLMALGFSASMAVYPPLAQWLIETAGWRQAWIWLGVLTIALLFPPVLVLVHDKPEDVGLRPDGVCDAEPATGSGATSAATAGLTLREALRTSAFYIIAAGLFSLSMLLTALHFFQVTIFAAQGLAPQVAANVFAVSAATMVVAMPVMGRLLDRLPTARMFSAGLLVTAATLVSAAMVQGLPSALAYAVMFGLSNAVSMSFFGFLWPRYFGRRHLGSIQGTGQMLLVIGASVGPLPFGLAYDLSGSFAGALLAAAVLPLGCAIFALSLRPPAQPTASAD
ncbi:MAG: MFS transporter [Alphaproteobacteria bacterium]